MRKFRISPALVLSMVALFVALGGGAYAAATIGSSQIKNNSVRSKDVKNGDLRGKDLKSNTIGGSRVLESSLAQVPSAAKALTAVTAGKATTADSAANAGDAGTLDGVDSTGFVKVRTRLRAISDTTADADYANDANLAQLSNLIAGQYSITAKLQVDNDTAAVEVIDCDLVKVSNAVQTVLDTSEQSLGAQGQAAQELNYVFTGTLNAAAGNADDVFLRCEQIGGDNDADEMRIVAELQN